MFAFAAIQSQRDGQELRRPLVNISWNLSGLGSYLFLSPIMSFDSKPGVLL